MIIDENVYKISFLILLIIYALIRLPYVIKYKKCVTIKDKSHLFERVKVLIASLGMVIIPSIYIFSNLFKSFSLELPQTIRDIAILIFMINSIFFYWIHKQLGNNWSEVVDIKEKQELITGGMYKYIRHPMYSLMWSWVILQLFITSNLVVGLFGIFSWAFLYFTRVGSEERIMTEQFGNKYIEYMHHTGRLFPKLF